MVVFRFFSSIFSFFLCTCFVCSSALAENGRLLGPGQQINWDSVRTNLVNNSTSTAPASTLARGNNPSVKSTTAVGINKGSAKKSDARSNTNYKDPRQQTKISPFIGIGMSAGIVPNKHTNLFGVFRLGTELIVKRSLYMGLTAFGSFGARSDDALHTLVGAAGQFAVGGSFNSFKTNLYFLGVVEYLDHVGAQDKYLMAGFGSGFKQTIINHLRFFFEYRIMFDTHALQIPPPGSMEGLSVILTSGFDFAV